MGFYIGKCFIVWRIISTKCTNWRGLSNVQWFRLSSRAPFSPFYFTELLIASLFLFFYNLNHKLKIQIHNEILLSFSLYHFMSVFFLFFNPVKPDFNQWEIENLILQWSLFLQPSTLLNTFTRWLLWNLCGTSPTEWVSSRGFP